MSEKSKTRGLGRGLNALFEDDEELASVLDAASDLGASPQGHASAPSDDMLSALPKQVLGVEQLEPSMAQPRMDFEPEALEALASSIKIHGILQPLLVRAKRDIVTGEVYADQYEIIAGERRWRAAQLAQLHEVPVIIREFEDEQALQIALIENLQREDLNPIEEALAYQRLIQEHEYTQAKLAEVLGKSRSHIANMTRMLSLPEPVLELVRHGDLSTGHARCLIPLEYPLGVAEKVMAEGMSVRATERYVQNLQARAASPPAKAGAQSVAPSASDPATVAQFDQDDASVSVLADQKDPNLLALERDLSNHLGLNVRFDMLKTGTHAGEICVEFKDLDQLDSIIALLKTSASSQSDEIGDNQVSLDALGARLLD